MRIVDLTFLLLAFLTTLSQSTAQALDPPTPTCVQVLANGDAVVNWAPTTDPLGEFVSYDLFFSTDYFTADLGNLIQTEGLLATASYTHAGADFNNNIGAYYFQTNSNDGSAQISIPSDTMCVVHLNVTPIDGGATANLFWNSPYLNSAGVTGDYEVWREFPVGVWTQVATVPHDPAQFNQNYQYEAVDCVATYNFQIFYTAPAGCQFISNIAGDDFEDLTAPDIPAVDVVTIDPGTNTYTLNWTPSTNPDTWGYIIYQCISGANVPQDTVYGAGISSWTDPTANGLILPANYYTVAAFDFCNFENVSPTESTCQQPPHLLDIGWAQCTNFAELLWTPYNGRDVDTYRIWVSENGGAPVIMAVLPGTDLLHTHEGVVDGITYQYYIEATFADTPSTSTSNSRFQTISLAPGPSFAYLAAVSVEDENTVYIKVHVENVLTTHSYHLQRRRKDGQYYTDVTVASAGGTDTVEMWDVDLPEDGVDLVLAELQYDYLVHVVNACNDTILSTNFGRNVLLEGLANAERLVNTLSFTDYFDWDGAISGYQIYRSEVKGDLGFVVGNLNIGQHVFEDDVSAELLTPGQFCYTVEVQEEVNSFGLAEVSFSNQLCLQMDPKIWVPNAFMVYGHNNVFMPVIGYANFTTYNMSIYSRWGDVLFQTSEISDGWDGRWRNDLVPEGAYVYHIEIEDGEGQLHERVGTVYMLVSGAE